jgi:L-ectoine synthase
MKIITLSEVEASDNQVLCPNKNFISNRFLLESDGMGYSITKTIIPKGTVATWHYKEHLESCYCISGLGVIRDYANDSVHKIEPDTLYVLDNNDKHQFTALEEVHLICVFNPPLKGQEVHSEDGSYSSSENGK